VEFGVLGPLDVRANGQALAIGPAKHRALLAALLLEPNHFVSIERLLTVLWGEEPPKSATTLLRLYVHNLRKLLGAVSPGEFVCPQLHTRPGGYLLEVAPEQLDWYRFRRLVEDARRISALGMLEPAADRLRNALALWRGPALADIESDFLKQGEGHRLEEHRLQALEARIEIDLRLGRHDELVGELGVLTVSHPERERLCQQLMLALYRSGRRAEALAVYRSTRQTLVEELGLEPSPTLQELERAILLNDPVLAAPDGTRRPALPPEPCQLPPDIDDFTGRETAAAEVQQLLEAELATAIVISAIAGKAGVGKTALAVRVAHRLRPRFPDGQLYVNLHGAEAQALDPADVLANFLRALGLEGVLIADGLEERVRQYRAQLADRRVLVVLDNAASEAQVRPLLPASRGCAALVTSRAGLGGLEAAHLLTLEVLDPDQAVELLAKLAGPARVALEPEAAQTIVRLCGLLPLAVRIAGARLAARPHWRLALLAERLADERRRLDELTAGDLEVRASVALSYQGCSQDEQRLFRLLGLLAASTFPAWVAAALLDTGPVEAERMMERLVDAQLVEAAGEDQAGQLRYRLHDLLRVFARERLEVEEPVPAQQASLQRAFQAYLTLAERADALVVPSGLGRYGSDLAGQQHADHPAVASVERNPLGWLEAERMGLIAAVGQACQAGLWEPSWRLATTLAGWFRLRAYWDDWQHTHVLALAAARRAGDRHAQARVIASLGHLYADRCRFQTAIRCLRQSLVAFREAGDRRGELQSLLTLGIIDVRQGRFDDAIARLHQSMAGFRQLGWRSGEALALRELGDVHRERGQVDTAIACLEQSLAVARVAGDRPWEASILWRLGLAHAKQDHFQPAVACLEQSLALVRATGDRLGEAYVLQGLGEIDRKQGRLDAATGRLQRSLVLVQATGDRAAEASGLHTLGDLHREQGRLEDAAGCLEHSLVAFRDLGYRHWEARVLDSLGMLLAAKRDWTAACSAWRAALTIFCELHMPEAAYVAARLDRQRS
jgi:DNA-binding SARP family transcriptional activator/tetratricopeptide (TPR) repeat protein